MKKAVLSILVLGIALSTQAQARRHGGGNWVGPAVGGAILGAIIANQAQSRPAYREEVIYREAPVYREVPVYRDDRGDYRDAKRRCASRYRSYDWRSETYVGYDGVVRSCP